MSEFKNSERYLEILQTIKFMKSGAELSESWKSNQAHLIREYRNASIDFTEIHEEIEDSEFRDAALNVENLLSDLCDDLFYSRPLNVPKFYEMMINMEIMCRAFISAMEFAECMEKLSF